MTEHTRLRPHWRPTHNADPKGFDRWIAPDKANGWVKILNPDGHLCRRVWAVAPDAWLCLRLHPMSEQKAEMLAAPVDLGRAHATQWHGWLMQHGLLDAARAGRVALEGINEAAIWQPGVSEALVAYEISRMEHTERLGLTAACCVMQVNTGWPGNHGVTDAPPDWRPFERLRVALLRMGGYLGVHEYWDARGPDSDDWTWNPGRILQQGEEWDGIPVLITECGYDQAVNAPEGTPHHGWQGHQSVDVAMAQLTEYDRRLRTEPRLRKRVKAAFVFTHDFDPPWGTFDTTPLTDRLCLHAEWTRQQAAPTEPSQTHTVHIPVVIGPPAQPDPEPTGEQPVPQPPAPPVDDWAEFQRCYAFTRRWEGGWANNPADKGGPTMRGITLATFTKWRHAQGMGTPTADDLRNICDDEVEAIYYQWYWKPSGSSGLPYPANLVRFDTAVLFGVDVARWYAQEAGPSEYALLGLRLLGHAGSVEDDPSQAVFWDGWRNRVMELREIVRRARGWS